MSIDLVFKLLNPSKFKKMAAEYGVKTTFSGFMISIVLFGLIGAGLGYYLRLFWYYILAVGIFFGAMMPYILMTFYKNKYESQRFEEATNYVEQMIYSFRKKQKIRVALEDVYGTVPGHIKDVVLKMIQYIDKGDAEHDLYEEALNMVQQEYDCSRIDTLHRYLTEVESHGGDSRKALGILLSDVRDWSTRTLVYQKNREAVRKKVGISIGLALFTSSMMFNFIPAEYVDGIIPTQMYQLFSILVLVLCVVIFMFISTKIADTYLDNEQRRKEINLGVRYVQRLKNYDKKKELKNTIIMCGISIAGALACFLLDLGYISLAPLGIALFSVYSFLTKKSSYKKKITKEINLVFPTWLRNLILHLQTDNVHVALATSLITCPPILKHEVRALLVGISNEPNSIRPYMEFMKDYNLPEFKGAIKFLYSIAEFGTGDMISQLDQLVQQNAALSAAAEDLRNESMLSGLTTLTFAPMLVACIKLLVDMGLFFSTFMGYISEMQ